MAAKSEKGGEEAKKGEYTLNFTELQPTAVKIAEHAVTSVLSGEVYEAARVTTWSDKITELALDELQKLSDNFKYAVSCIIMQKNGAGIATSGSAHWDEQTDACAQVVWQENRTIVCILTIMGVAI
mmetsp:Transcript_39034/g.89922  ORF Transcript_39034/g.89922 Transcript_39034/m.89922 type:complete len:126 (+) Transcript_39034:29-406(+)|eukprot:CAMPEP_0182549712 /NCGR_PEP_ID=MMETSP1323-20130603/40578_1 /TAXON_ID=236787 /ORGANISM="Florenciella parvula, Strain RCC1693" /LENGTH=125 /DNA_ID=CAMNT_0024761199 /DNA_START=18 /DNA_END=395 /DNA_ORIENTATION=-